MVFRQKNVKLKRAWFFRSKIIKLKLHYLYITLIEISIKAYKNEVNKYKYKNGFIIININ